MNACSNAGNAVAPFGTSATSLSGSDHKPPQMPGEGRFTSSTSPLEIATSIAVARRRGAARFLRPGSSATRASLAAMQSARTGQAAQRGARARHNVAPRSISPCV